MSKVRPSSQQILDTNRASIPKQDSTVAIQPRGYSGCSSYPNKKKQNKKHGGESRGNKAKGHAPEIVTGGRRVSESRGRYRAARCGG